MSKEYHVSKMTKDGDLLEVVTYDKGEESGYFVVSSENLNLVIKDIQSQGYYWDGDDEDDEDDFDDRDWDFI